MNFTPLFRIILARRAQQLARLDPAVTQEAQLLSLVATAQNTKFGRDHGFSKIRSVADYQRQVPLRRYEDIWESYWKPAFPNIQGTTWPSPTNHFAVSSGTSSGRTKYIPCTSEMIRSNTKAGVDLLTHHLTNRPKSQLLGGKSFILGGSTAFKEEAPGIWSGDLSGIAAKTMAWWARLCSFPPAHLSVISDWEKKIATLARESLNHDIRMLSGVPAWMLLLMKEYERLVPHSEGKISRVFKNFELLVHGGVNFSPYKQPFQEILAESHAELREVYPASEGFIAMADRGPGEGLRLMLDHGIFFEFVPFDELSSPAPTRHWVHNIECGVNYAIVLSTCAGLWSYVLGDTVRFVERSPARLLVTGRTSYYLSAFGEHLTAEEVESSVAHAAERIDNSVTDYVVGPIYPASAAELGGHRFIVEFCKPLTDKDALDEFAQVLDKTMQLRNEDYEAHRSAGFGLRGPTIVVVPPGFFAEWMRSKGKLGGQHKVPRIMMDQMSFAELTARSAEVSPAASA